MSIETLNNIAVEIRESYVPNSNEDVAYIGLEHVTQQSLQLIGYGSSKEMESNKYRFKKGDILFSTLRPYFRKVAIAPFDGVCSTEYSVIRPKDEEYRNFVFYFIANEKFIEYATTNSVGARPRTKWKLYSDYAIRQTSKLEKISIGEKLRAFDNLIENNRRRIQLIEESARLLYQEWFVQMRFPGHEQVNFTNGVPDGWSKEPLENLLILQRGFDLPVSNRIEGNVPIYASTGINGFHNVAKVKGPGVVTGRSGSLGTVMYVAGDFWPLNTALWVKVFKKASPIFSTFLLRAMKLEGYNGGAAVPTLNRNDVHKVDVLCPESKIMNEFEIQVRELFKQIDKLKEYNEKLAQARDLLLPKLMNGELTV